MYLDSKEVDDEETATKTASKLDEEETAAKAASKATESEFVEKTAKAEEGDNSDMIKKAE